MSMTIRELKAAEDGTILYPTGSGFCIEKTPPSFAGNDHIVIAAGTMDDEDIAAFIPPGDDSHMAVIRVKYEIAGKCVCPGDRRAAGMLAGRAAAMTDCPLIRL